MIAHLINTDVGNRGIKRLYLEYRRRNFSFLEDSARAFMSNIDRTLIITGFPVPPIMVPETDGPPGAVALAKAVESLGGKAEILTYPEIREALEGLSFSFVRKPRVSKYSLVVAIETPGMSADGGHYSMSGAVITRETFDGVVVEAKERGIPTIGIGDGGNEVGMGNVRDLVERYIPMGRKIGSVVEVDHLITAGVSNWGAYGLIAEASLLRGENLLGSFNEVEIVEALVGAGLVDGVTKRAEKSVDGISIKVHEKMLNLLKAMVEKVGETKKT